MPRKTLRACSFFPFFSFFLFFFFFWKFRRYLSRMVQIPVGNSPGIHRFVENGVAGAGSNESRAKWCIRRTSFPYLGMRFRCRRGVREGGSKGQCHVGGQIFKKPEGLRALRLHWSEGCVRRPSSPLRHERELPSSSASGRRGTRSASTFRAEPRNLRGPRFVERKKKKFKKFSFF